MIAFAIRSSGTDQCRGACPFPSRTFLTSPLDPREINQDRAPDEPTREDEQWRRADGELLRRTNQGAEPPMILKCKVVKRPGNHLLQREPPRSGRGEVFRLAEIPSVNSRDRPQDRHRSSTTRRRCSMFVASRSPSRRVGSPRCAIPTLVLSIVATGGPAPCMAQGLGHGIPTPPPVDSSFRQINDEHHGTPQAHLAGPRIAELKRPIKYRRFRELEGHDVREQS